MFVFNCEGKKETQERLKEIVAKILINDGNSERFSTFLYNNMAFINTDDVLSVHESLTKEIGDSNITYVATLLTPNETRGRMHEEVINRLREMHGSNGYVYAD